MRDETRVVAARDVCPVAASTAGAAPLPPRGQEDRAGSDVPPRPDRTRQFPASYRSDIGCSSVDPRMRIVARPRFFHRQ